MQYQFNGYSSNIESNIFLTFHRQIEIPVLSKERDLVSNFFTFHRAIFKRVFEVIIVNKNIFRKIKYDYISYIFMKKKNNQVFLIR